jgi:hypothetical protein
MGKVGGIVQWVTVCLIGSVIYGLIFTSWFNSLENYTNLNVFESLFVIFVLLVVSLVFSLPFLIYMNVREKLKNPGQPRIMEYNISFFIFCLSLFLIFSHQMKSYKEGLELILPYFMTGSVALNVYFGKLKIWPSNDKNGSEI